MGAEEENIDFGPAPTYHHGTDGDQKEFAIKGKGGLETEVPEEDLSPIEEVNLTVENTDDPTLPVWTFRMWFMGLLSCVILALLNQFFSYRTEPLGISALTAQIVALPLGRLMERALPKRVFFKGTRFAWSLNPGPFNMKEHCLITIFANAGAGGPYAINIVTIVKAIYQKKLSFIASLIITITTQLIGFGWAGIFRNYLVKPGVMWWPSNLVQVSLFRTMHEPDVRSKGGVTRFQFFLTVLAISFSWYALPGYLFPMLSSLSWVCWAFPNSVLAHQLGSGMSGLGLGAIGIDWATVSSFLGTPLATPWFAIANIAVGYFIVMYIITPLAYFMNVYNAKNFPIFSSSLFRSTGETYDVEEIISSTFTLDLPKYEQYGRLHISTFFAMTYGVGFAALTCTITHVALFYGRNIWKLATRAARVKEDVHTKLMNGYSQVPEWWFQVILVTTITVAIIGTEVFNEQLQLRWWGILLACGIAFFFTLPIGIIAATTNQVPGLNIITEYIIGYLYPGHPVANVSFKTYGYISMTQAVGFLADFKLGHYMKIPPRSMFVTQVVGTVVSAVASLVTAWWMLGTIQNICLVDLLPPNSPWTCPGDRVFFDASVIWGLVGPKRIFGTDGIYKLINWWFLGGALAPVPVWVATKIWPNQRWLYLVNMPILIGATGNMPPATSINYITWILVGFIFNFLIFRRRKAWWSRYNYLLSAGLDGGLAFMGVALYFMLQYESININWWGVNLDNCPLASCPTQPGLGQPNPNCPPV
ncbi:unnamed protein product [Calypogeia fissa]